MVSTRNLICSVAGICCLFFLSNTALAQQSDLELLVRTTNTLGKAPHNPLRLRGIAQKFHSDWQNQIGLIGMQEAKGGMSGCKVSRSHHDAAKCFAGELSQLFALDAVGVHTGDTTDVEVGIVFDSNWSLIEHKQWGIHSTFLGFGAWHRKLLMVHLRHRTLGHQLRFYSVHFTPGSDEKRERKYQANRVVNIVKEQARAGELPPIVVGDFNASRSFITGAAEESIRILETHFWRPIDRYRSDETGIDVVYIGKKGAFPGSVGDFEAPARHYVAMAGPISVDGVSLAQLSDHASEGFRVIYRVSTPPVDEPPPGNIRCRSNGDCPAGQKCCEPGDIGSYCIRSSQVCR